MRRECSRILRGLGLVALLAPVSLPAHDFWIEPASFRPAAGADTPIRLYVGQDFKGNSLVYLPSQFERYALVGAAGEQPVAGVAGDDPAGQFRARQTGPHILVFRGTVASVDFDSVAEFEQYLAKEGLERVQALPDYARRVGHRPIRERYSRCAKSLVAVGGGALADRPVGLALELVAEADPGASRALPVRLMHEGRPLAGALVIAFRRSDPTNKLKVRTDDNGRALLPLTGAGLWLVTAVHLMPAAWYTKAEWESLWASLTFEIPTQGKTR